MFQNYCKSNVGLLECKIYGFIQIQVFCINIKNGVILLYGYNWLIVNVDFKEMKD